MDKVTTHNLIRMSDEDLSVIAAGLYLLVAGAKPNNGQLGYPEYKEKAQKLLEIIQPEDPED